MRRCDAGGPCDDPLYLHGDDTSYSLSTSLGSVSLTTDSSGAVVAQARYMPYGEVRWESSPSPTDYAFTGQRAEHGFGLLDFNARYFSPRLGRFISADTIVPNPGSAMDFDRYAYAAGNPIRYRDPSGHLYCNSKYAAEDICEGWIGSGNEFEDAYGITFTNNGREWSQQEKDAAAWAAYSTGLALMPYTTSNNAAEAFTTVFGLLTFARSAANPDYWAEYNQGGTITFYAGARQWMTLVPHELGHAFNAHIANNGETTPYDTLFNDGIWLDNGEQVAGYREGYTVPRTGTTCGDHGNEQCFDNEGNPIPANHYLRRSEGFGFRRSRVQTANEDFADMFANWVTGKFTDDVYGEARSDFMTTNMSEWVSSSMGK